jgi:alkylation response protein AidB-like acyl-CoA dehydrogenase
MDQLGVSIGRKLDKVGMRSSDTAELVFDNVRIPRESLLGKEGRGFYHIMWELQGERLIAAAGCIGMARHAYDLAYYQAKKQKLLNQQVISHLLVEMAAEIEAVSHLMYSVAYQFSNGEIPSKEISMTKLSASQLAHWVADRAFQIFGISGYEMDNPIQRIWRDSRLYRIGGGTDEIMKEIIAKQMKI